MFFSIEVCSLGKYLSPKYLNDKRKQSGKQDVVEEDARHTSISSNPLFCLTRFSLR